MTQFDIIPFDAGDALLIAGKGHETGQEVHGTVHPFDDREVALEALRGLPARPDRPRPA